MKRLLPVAVTFAMVFAIAAPAFAATVENAETVHIQEASSDDLYVAGEEAIVDAEVGGDLVVIGGTVQVQQAVHGDLIAAGGHIDVTGSVADDARIAGGTVTISGKIGDDLIVAGGTVKILASAVIGGDVVVFGGKVEMLGSVGGVLKARGGSVMLSGTVSGGATINGEDVTINGGIGGPARLMGEDLRIGSEATFADSVQYWTRSGKADFGNSVASGTAVYSPQLKSEMMPNRYEGQAFTGTMAVLFGVWSLVSLLAAAVLILLFMTLPGDVFTLAAKRVRTSPWTSVLAGFVYFVITPIALATLAITIVGLPIALFGFAVYGFSVYVAGMIAAMVAARWLEYRLGKHWKKSGFFFASFGLYVALKALWLVPVVGWIVRVVLIVIAMGALLLAKKDWWKSIRKPSRKA